MISVNQIYDIFIALELPEFQNVYGNGTGLTKQRPDTSVTSEFLDQNHTTILDGAFDRGISSLSANRYP